jgi:hypothetical protein
MEGEVEGKGTVFGSLESRRVSATSNPPIVAQHLKWPVQLQQCSLVKAKAPCPDSVPIIFPGDIRITPASRALFSCVSRCSTPIRPLFQARNRCYYGALLLNAHRSQDSVGHVQGFDEENGTHQG